MAPSHPGSIVLVDVDGSQRTVMVSEVGEEIAFVTLNGRPVPVVRVVAHTLPDDGRRLDSFGADGSKLASLYQRRTAK